MEVSVQTAKTVKKMTIQIDVKNAELQTVFLPKKIDVRFVGPLLRNH